MKHHFGDLLDRDGEHWTIVPNRERYAHRIDAVTAGDPTVRIMTIGAEDASWRDVFTFPGLEELTLHAPTAEQLLAISGLHALERLRITHARPKSLDFLRPLERVSELVLEYVSGFQDLSPLRSLPRLRSLHLENLRRVRDFGGISGIATLRYLSIDGTLDWKQPIADFGFLGGLPALEVLALGRIITDAPFPALLPALALRRLSRLRLPWNMLAAEEYALLEEGLPGVAGAAWGPFTRFTLSGGEDWFEYTGKGAGRVKCGHPDADSRCAAYAATYEAMKAEARRVISRSRRG